MNKKECIDRLLENGTEAKDTDGVVTVKCHAEYEKDFQKYIIEFRNTIREMGYTGSFAIKWIKDTADKLVDDKGFVNN